MQFRHSDGSDGSLQLMTVSNMAVPEYGCCSRKRQARLQGRVWQAWRDAADEPACKTTAAAAAHARGLAARTLQAWASKTARVHEAGAAADRLFRRVFISQGAQMQLFNSRALACAHSALQS